jgi:MFS transporter, OFA family, oxalate/formate antiporter
VDPARARLLAAATAVNLAAGTLFAWSILLPPLTEDLGGSAAATSSVFSAALVLFAAVVLVAGGLADERSPRALAIASGLVMGAGLTVCAAAPSLPVVAIGYGGLFGVGSGLAYVTVVSVAGTRFEERRGLALGVVVGAYAAGPILVGPLGTLAIEAVGWRPTVAALALLIAGATAAAARWLPSAPAKRDRPSRATSASELPGPRTAGLWSLWALFLLSTAPGLLAFSYTTDIALERGLSTGAAGAVVGLLAAGNLVGRLVAGPLSDRWGTVATIALTLFALTAAVAVLGWLSAAAVALVALPVLGAQYGAISAVLPAATADLVGTERFGASYGRVFTSWGVAGVLGPAAGGWLHAGAGTYRPAFQASLVCAVLAVAALIAFARALTGVRTRSYG